MRFSLRWSEILQFHKSTKSALASNASGKDRYVRWALIVAAAMLFLGVTVPVIRVHKLFIFNEDVSILGGIWTLYASGEFFVATVIVVFSIAFPLYKISVADYAWRRCPADSHQIGEVLQILDWVGRWSMLDVLIVALIIFSVKATAIANAESAPGLYFFAGSIGLMSWSVSRIKQAARRNVALLHKTSLEVG